MTTKRYFIIAAFIMMAHTVVSQRNFEGYNLLGLTGGVTLFDINTSDLITKSGTGFEGGFTTRGAFYNDFDLIYGLSIYYNEIGVQGSTVASTNTQFIDYDILAAQLGMLLSYNIIYENLSLCAGPILNVSSKMKLKDRQYENYIIDGYNTVLASDIQDISRVNFHVAGGLTVGLRNFRISGLYQYGITNILNKLNDKKLEKTDFSGHSSTITIAATIYF